MLKRTILAHTADAVGVPSCIIFISKLLAYKLFQFWKCTTCMTMIGFMWTYPRAYDSILVMHYNPNTQRTNHLLMSIETIYDS
jgi:hypothetical protein